MLSELKTVPRTELLLGGLMLAGMVVTSVYLLPFWRESAELSHGFFTPVLCIWLLWLSRNEPSCCGDIARRGWVWLTTALFLVIAPVAGMAALAQGGGHSQTAFLAALAFAIFLVGGVAALAGGHKPIVPLNGASFCAAGLWLFAAPLPSGTLSRLTLLLQDQITGATLGTLRLLGISAMRHGNVLELSQQLVGVEEACSGIRSLVACLFAGVFLGGYLLRGIWPRFALVAGAAIFAVVANFLRSLLLCVMVSRGVEISGWWHDMTAYGVLGLTVILLYSGCSLLASGKPVSLAEPEPGSGINRLAVGLQLGLILTALTITGYVVQRTIPDARELNRQLPDLAELMDIDASGWIHGSNSQIIQFSDALNTQHLHEETYLRGDTQVTFYMAYWPAGQTTLGSVGLHTPDLCLPGSGWTPVPLPDAIGSYPLAKPRRFSFEKNNYPQYVWFWHYYGGHLVEPLPGLYPWQLAPYLIRRPVSSSAAQWVVRVSSNQPLGTLLDEPLMKEFFTKLKTARLTGTQAP